MDKIVDYIDKSKDKFSELIAEGKEEVPDTYEGPKAEEEVIELYDELRSTVFTFLLKMRKKR